MKKKFKKLVGLAGMNILVLLCCAACSGGQQEIPQSGTSWNESVYEEDYGQQNENVGESGNAEQGQSDLEFYAGADLQGSVVEFSDSGFKMSVAKNIKVDGGELMVQAAPGAENEEDLVTITYASDVTFEIITMDSTSLTEISREDTDKQSVKKQSDVLVFGSCQDTYNWIADKVIIMRWK